MRSTSPLQYPGSKFKAKDILFKYIPKNTEFLVSPFLGGGAFEIFVANSGIKVQAYDIVPQLVCFWKEILSNPHRLADEIEKYLPLKKERYYELRADLRNYNDSWSDFDAAVVFFVLNRSSFSGTGLAGGMINNHPQFTQSSIDAVRNFKCSNLSVDLLSSEESIKKHDNCSFYLDPPYFLENGSCGKGNLYGTKGHAHMDFNHDELYKNIKDKDNWFMSYNDNEYIKKLYKNYKIIDLEWKYAMNQSKKSSEILIFSNNL